MFVLSGDSLMHGPAAGVLELKEEPMAVPMTAALLRRWFALDLIRLREQAGLSQAEAARELGCAQSRISYIENRRNMPKDADIRVLLPLYGQAELVEDYIALLAQAKRRSWWDGLDGIPDWFDGYLGYEAGASAVEMFEPQVVIGALQTEDYARALIRQAEPDLSGSEVERRVQVRLGRQEQFGRDDTAQRLWVVLAESAVRCAIGGPAVHRAQLQHLVKMAERPRLEVQVLPTAAGAHPALHGAFTILRFPIEGDPGVVYLEDRIKGRYYETQAAIDEYTQVLNRLRVQALDQAHSRAFIATIAEEIQ